jgi:hypothetical protein
MSDFPLNSHDPRWDLVVQRSTLDPAYRERLMSAPNEVLQEAGIAADGLDVVVHEFSDNRRVLLLPPAIPAHSPPDAPARSASFSSDPPSAPLYGPAACALGVSLHGAAE